MWREVKGIIRDTFIYTSEENITSYKSSDILTMGV